MTFFTVQRIGIQKRTTKTSKLKVNVSRRSNKNVIYVTFNMIWRRNLIRDLDSNIGERKKRIYPAVGDTILDVGIVAFIV